MSFLKKVFKKVKRSMRAVTPRAIARSIQRKFVGNQSLSAFSAGSSIPPLVNNRTLSRLYRSK